MEFINLYLENLTLNLGLNQLLQKGLLVYEYNPLKVLRTSKDIMDGDTVMYPRGSLVDLDTNLLLFDLNHPVNIITQQSYDGSVNLILNDGHNYPKLINTRFSSTGMDTYKIVDREGDNDTNIYDEDTFDSDISLYKKINIIPKVTFTGVNTDGNLKVGNYVFYFKLSDSDGNETDFIAESGIVTCYIGELNDPKSILGGIEDLNSYKSVRFLLTNIDSSYNNVVVYYTRSTSDISGNEHTSSFKINKLYSIYNNVCTITINGLEQTEEISINDINTSYNVVDSAESQAICQNRLFLANIKNPEIEYKELADLSLYFLPSLNVKNSIGRVDENYEDNSEGANYKYEYYNVLNIYNRLGYWNDIYRLGIVYILNDFTLSPVFNIRGCDELNEDTSYYEYHPFKQVDGSYYVPSESDSIDTIKRYREYIATNKDNYKLDKLSENSKGVIKINYQGNQFQDSGTYPIGLNFKVRKDVVLFLKRMTRGFFFVRLKRIPTTLCLAVTIGLENTSCLPTLPIQGERYFIERFIDDDRILTHDLERRKEEISSDNVILGYAALCPEFELKQAYFNQLFTGTKFTVEFSKSLFNNKYFNRSGTHLYNLNYVNYPNTLLEEYNILAVGDNIKNIKGKLQLYSARAGEAEEAFRVSYYKYKNKSKEAQNILRGSFGPYLGLEGYNNSKMSLINIKVPNYSEAYSDNDFQIRYLDSSPFYAISDRMVWEDIPLEGEDYKIENIYRGDCFIGNYTHRMLRNFLDPTAPINDDIVDLFCWKDNYSVDNEELNNKINRGDVNAVKLGHWVTFKVCSNVNISLRSLDPSYTSEYGLTGKYRGFYPLQAMSVSGESKIPESFVTNEGLNSTTSDKYNFEVPNVPAIKNISNTKIMYSDLNVNDSFKNGFRVFRLGNYKEFPSTYGSITKILEFYGNILCVFEHGVALIPVNERTVNGSGVGGEVFINTSNVLPDNPKVLSDTFGTLWPESVIKTAYYAYGVDTVGKKIWRTNGQTFEIISDFKIQKFLNDNISLLESEKSPIIGIRNVKTHYNKFKQDLMFTFYDDINTLEEKVWSICYNEIMLKFITFYSWIPSYSENIDNIFFSFDRTTSKNIAKLTSNYPLISLKEGGIFKGTITPDAKTLLGTLKVNLDTENSDIEYRIADDRVRNLYDIVGDKLYVKENVSLKNWTVPIEANIFQQKQVGEELVKEIIKTVTGQVFVIPQEQYDGLTTLFWKHGLAGLMKTNSSILPCNWYGDLHPFEFEFIVVDNPSVHKIFDNLQIISNKARPQSFHFEIVGESYKFANDKINAYFRLEATKHVYLYNGGDVKYDSNYLTVNPKQRDILYSKSKYKDASIMFPLFYSRVSPLNTIYDYYLSKTSAGNDYLYISGSEIVYDKLLNEYKIATHIKGCPFDETFELELFEYLYKKQLDINDRVFVTCIRTDAEGNQETIKERIDFWEIGEDGLPIYTKTDDGYVDKDLNHYTDIKYFMVSVYGRLNGNMNYQEDKWDIQIPPITYWAKNEEEWKIVKGKNKYPPLNVVNNPLPESMESLKISLDKIPSELRDLGYKDDLNSFDVTKWGPDRKETKIRDKYIKIKVRYKGDDLAVITALKTLYTVSYA